MFDTIVSCKCSFCINKDTVLCGHRTCATCIVDGIASPSCICPEVCKLNEAAKLNVICMSFVMKDWDQ